MIDSIENLQSDNEVIEKLNRIANLVYDLGVIIKSEDGEMFRTLMINSDCEARELLASKQYSRLKCVVIEADSENGE